MNDNKEIPDALIKELVSIITKGNAHATFDQAVANISFENVSITPKGLPYNIWKIVEHIRITQNDILDFSKNPDYKPLKWPENYWPSNNSPLNEAQWKNCIQQIKADRDEFISLITNNKADLYTPFMHGEGQNLLREALLIADHAAYHTGQIILIRRLLNDWTT